MKYTEYGKDNRETLILLHGGGLSWWDHREAGEILADRFHVILPILDGHAGSDRHFTTIEDNAREIIDFIDSELGGRVLLLGGLSLGAQIALEILSQRGDICDKALIESAAVIPSRLTNSLIGPAFSSSYSLIKSRTFAKRQFKSLHIKSELFEEYYRDTCLIEKDDLIAFMKANTAYELKESIRDTSADVHIYIGDKETSEIKRSAEKLSKELPNSSLTVLKGLYHGEFSINNPEKYAEEVRKIISL